MSKEIAIVGGFEGGALSFNNPPRAPLQIASATVGFDSVVLHACKIGSNWPEKLPEHSPLTGVSILTWNEWNELPAITARIKLRNPKTKIVVGGKYPSIYTQETLAIPGVDMVARGYADAAWTTITSNFNDGKPINNLEQEGIYNNHSILPNKDNLTVSLPVSLKKLPQPAYDSLLPRLESYIQPDKSSLNDLMKMPFSPNVLSALGCLWECTFCMNTLLKSQDNFGRQSIEKRPPPLIAEEIMLLQQKTGLVEIPIFLMNPDSGQDIEHLLTTVDQIDKKGAKALLGIDIRVHSLFESLVERSDLVKKLNNKLHKVVLAPETFHPETQISIGKETDPDELIACLMFCEEIGALPMVQIIVGFPVDSEKTLQYTLDKILEVRDQAPPFILNVHRATPFWGTTLHKEAKYLGLIDSNSLIPDMTSGEMVMGSRYLSKDQLNIWKKKFISDFYTEKYLNRLMADRRDLLRQEVANSQVRGMIGEISKSSK